MPVPTEIAQCIVDEFNNGTLSLPFTSEELEDDPNSFPYTYILTATLFVMMAAALVKKAHDTNRIEYNHWATNIFAGFIQLFMRWWHMEDSPIEVPSDEASIVAIGKHLTGLDGLAVGTQLVNPGEKSHPDGKGKKHIPPRFFATTGFSRFKMPYFGFNVPTGVGPFLRTFQAIPVEFDAKKRAKGGAKSNALAKGIEALEQGGCVAIFPQGNFAYVGQRPPIVYSGTAKLAIKTKTPIYVIRLDGFWSIYNPCIPLFIRNNKVYKAFLSLLHLNNIKTTRCAVIDFHLKEENQHLSEAQMINEINARLYAYFSPTEELDKNDIDNISADIDAGLHIPSWRKAQQEHLFRKELSKPRSRVDDLMDEPLEAETAALLGYSLD